MDNWAEKQHFRMISEWSCETEDWSKKLEYFTINIFDQTSAALVRIRYLFHKLLLLFQTFTHTHYILRYINKIYINIIGGLSNITEFMLY